MPLKSSPPPRVEGEDEGEREEEEEEGELRTLEEEEVQALDLKALEYQLEMMEVRGLKDDN